MECVETLSVLQKCNDTSLIKSLCCLSWQPKHGKTLAIPVGNEVKVYDRSSWKCLFTLSEDHHKEAVNVVSWSPCGRYLASGGADGSMCLWDVHSQKAYGKYKNVNGIGITSLEWDPRGCGARNGDQVVFADRKGFVGVFEDVYPSNKPQYTNPLTLNDNDDTNLVMEVASQSRQLHLGQPLVVSDSHSLLGKSSLGSRREPMLHPHTSPKRLCTSSESSEQSNRSNTPDTSSVGAATITATNTPSITTSVTDTANPTQHLQECVDQALPLPREERQVVKDKCTDLHFSDLVKADGQLWAHTVISRGAEGEGIEGELRRGQLQAIFDLPGEPLEPWGDNIDEVLENGDMCMWWVHVGFHVNDDPSDLLEYDLWMCAEVHHWHAPFVFPAGSDKMVLRYDPIEWIQKPTREDKGSAETLSELTEALIWSAFEDM